jgi:hypothetical protein
MFENSNRTFRLLGSEQYDFDKQKEKLVQTINVIIKHNERDCNNIHPNIIHSHNIYSVSKKDYVIFVQSFCHALNNTDIGSLQLDYENDAIIEYWEKIAGRTIDEMMKKQFNGLNFNCMVRSILYDDVDENGKFENFFWCSATISIKQDQLIIVPTDPNTDEKEPFVLDFVRDVDKICLVAEGSANAYRFDLQLKPESEICKTFSQKRISTTFRKEWYETKWVDIFKVENGERESIRIGFLCENKRIFDYILRGIKITNVAVKISQSPKRPDIKRQKTPRYKPSYIKRKQLEKIRTFE